MLCVILTDSFVIWFAASSVFFRVRNFWSVNFFCYFLYSCLKKEIFFLTSIVFKSDMNSVLWYVNLTLGTISSRSLNFVFSKTLNNWFLLNSLQGLTVDTIQSSFIFNTFSFLLLRVIQFDWAFFVQRFLSGF